MTKAHLDLMAHAIGMTKTGARRSLRWWLDDDNHRNNYCVCTAALSERGRLEHLVGLGYMKPGVVINGGRDQYYHATKLGIRATRELFRA